MLIIDRFESDYAICEADNGNKVNIHISLIPKTAKEGTVLIEKSGEILIDTEQTNKRRAEIIKLQNNLWE